MISVEYCSVAVLQDLAKGVSIYFSVRTFKHFILTQSIVAHSVLNTPVLDIHLFLIFLTFRDPLSFWWTLHYMTFRDYIKWKRYEIRHIGSHNEKRSRNAAPFPWNGSRSVLKVNAHTHTHTPCKRKKPTVVTPSALVDYTYM